MKSNREIVNMALNRKACNGKFKVGDKVKSNYGVSGSGTIMKITPSTGWLGNTLEVKWDDGDITHPCEGQVHLSNSTACNGGTDYYIEYKNGKKEAFHGFGEGAIERKLRNNPLVELYGGVKKITLEDGSEYKVKNTEEVATNELAAKSVIKNALTVEDQRANEEDKKKVKAAIDRINAKGAPIAKDILAYYAMNEKMLAEEKRLNAAVSALVKEARDIEKSYFSERRVYEDNELITLLDKLARYPGWADKAYRGSISFPTLISVPTK